MAALLSVFASCAAPAACTSHKDDNKDNICDVCSESIKVKCSVHKDKNNDGVCDTCAEVLPAWVDYVANTKLDMSSETLKKTVKVKLYIDGDTTHFHAPAGMGTDGVVKARYLGVNTPESTGTIEEWGKPASDFTKDKLSNAYSIMIEAEGPEVTKDSNGRELLWIWYQPTEGAEYRNLNIELLQEGLGRGASASEGRYGEQCFAAMMQAKTYGLYVFSEDKDESFPYDAATAVTLKELRTNITKYVGQNVEFVGIVSRNIDGTAYIESYDALTDRYYGIQIFYGYNAADFVKILAPGNEARVKGTVTEFQGTYQVCNLTHSSMRPDERDTVVVSKGHTPAFTEITPEDLTSMVKIPVTKVDASGESYEEEAEFKSADLMLFTSVSMKNLKVKDVYTTQSQNQDSNGAMTLTCEAEDGSTVSVRTGVIKHENGDIVRAAYFEGETIDVKGIVEFFQPEKGAGKYQIKSHALSDFVIHNG